MPAPPAASTPIAKISPAVLVMNGVMNVPSATRETPINSTRAVPIRSAIAPANGCVRPHQSCPNANATLIEPSPKPVVVFSGDRNRPIVWRTPIVSAKVAPAASNTSQNAGIALALVVLALLRSPLPGNGSVGMCGLVQAGLLQREQAVVQQCM